MTPRPGGNIQNFLRTPIVVEKDDVLNRERRQIAMQHNLMVASEGRWPRICNG